MTVPPPLGGPPPEMQPVAPVGSGNSQAAAPVANALAHSQQPAPADAEPPEPQSQEIPAAIRAEKGQIAFHVVKLLALVVFSPILLPLACFKLLGWTIGSMGSDSLAAFKASMARGVHDTFKPLTRQFDGIIGGVIGVTGKGYRMIKKFHKENAAQPPPAVQSARTPPPYSPPQPPPPPP